MWRTTPLHRRETEGSPDLDGPPSLPAGHVAEDVQEAKDGWGPLFRRRYRAVIRDADVTPEELCGLVSAKIDRVAPTELATFRKVEGEDGVMRVGDEYVVRMPGPWDGPVRVAEVSATAFRLVTLEGHLEAGQIEFRFSRDGVRLVFEIESWARSGDRVSDLLYQHLRMAKEVQLHLWTSMLEQVAELAGGRLTGGVDIDTRRVAGRG
jgi:hypothetical protein